MVDEVLDLWQGLEAGGKVDQNAAALCGVNGITLDARRKAVNMSLAELLAEEILAPADATEPLSVAFQLAGRTGRTFTPQALTMHTNMLDLLMLDPIHDVDEQGWPSAPPLDAGA